MNTSNKNSKISPALKFYELSWAFCVLFLTTSFFLGGSNFKSEKQKANQYNTHSTSVHKSRPTHQANALSEFDLIEEPEPTDESTEDGGLENDYSVLAPVHYIYSVLKNSSASYGLRPHKRVFIPLFLLHHSWKIPSAS